MTNLSLTSPPRPLGVLLVLLALVVTACASDDAAPADGPGEAQPGVAAGAPIDSELADLPVPSAAAAAGEVVDQEGVQTQSYVVTATAPELVLDFYTDALDDLGWTLEERTALPRGVRAVWTQAGDQLLITANPDGQDTSLNLQLSDA